MPTGQPTKVFVSYSHDSPGHKERVLALANQLRADGIDAILDQYEISPPEGWPRWMDRQIDASDFVLLVCTETYYRRVMGREVPDRGHGVIWESNLIYQLIYDAAAAHARFIPILLSGGTPRHIPRPLRGATHYNLHAEDGYELLYRRL
ncbi:MAG: TIR domain-containing protein, partial [Rhodospirillales bacterium]|nr:TIR domain-containing protein [Rhodospirillales bacterium]